MGLLWKEKEKGQKAKCIFEIKEKRLARKGKGLYIFAEMLQETRQTHFNFLERGEKKEVGGGRGRKQQEEEEERRHRRWEQWQYADGWQSWEVRILSPSLSPSLFLSFFLCSFSFTTQNWEEATLSSTPFPFFLNCRLNENLKFWRMSYPNFLPPIEAVSCRTTYLYRTVSVRLPQGICHIQVS